MNRNGSKLKASGFKLTNSSHSIKGHPYKYLSNTSLTLSNQIGFPNLGNTCYINASIQALFGLPKLVQDANNLMEELDKIGNPYIRLVTPFLEAMRANNSTSAANSVYFIKKELQERHPEFMGQRMHDASEFMIKLLESVQENLQHFYQQNTSLNGFPNLVEENFLSEREASFKCAKCKTVDATKHYDLYHFCSLSVLSGEELPVPLENLVQTLFETDEVRERRCEECAHDFSLTSNRLLKPPRILVITIKMFDYIQGSAKVAVPIALPQKIDLTKYVSGHGDLPNSQVTERLRPQTEDEEQKQLEAALKLSLMQDCTSSCTYRLASVVRHYGESANSGHYVADVHNFEQDAWFRFDDDRVSQVNKQEVHHSDNAYIVMYVRESDVDISRLSHDSKQNGKVSERGTNLQVPPSELVNPAKRVKRHLFQTIPTNQQSAVVLTPVKTIEPNREINLYKQSEPGSSPEYPIKLNLTTIRDFKLDVGEYLLDDQVKIDVLGIIYKDGKKFVVNDIDQVNIPSAYVCVKKRKEKYYLILTEK